MRQSVAFVAVLSGAAGLGALLVMPGRRTVDADLPPPVEAPSPSPVPTRPTSTPSARSRPEPPPVPAHVQLDPETAAACDAGMALVQGVYCPFVGHRCAAHEDEARDVCATFAPEAICEGALQRRRFCIDLHEYPNSPGARPAVWVSFDDAKRACAIEGKRLCAAEEWELACEGTGMWPYPYGLSRDATACNDARRGPSPDSARLEDPWRRSDEVTRADGRVASGSQPACVSPFGVYDLTGNVEEWVEHANGNAKEKPFRTARKGGSWSRGRARCRPIDGSEPGWHRAHDLGFRCCSDARGSTPAVRTGAAAGPDLGRSGAKRRVLLPSPP